MGSPVEFYSELREAIRGGMSSLEAEQVLRGIWADRYSRDSSPNLLEDLAHGSASYLFDRAVDVGAPQPDRTIGAYGFVEPPAEPRETNYQAGFPMPSRLGLSWDRGHMFPHTGGGLFGPNLFSQAPELNRGWSDEGKLYRATEKRVVAGKLFFFCALLYCDNTDISALIELGYVEDRELTVHVFRNRLDPVALARFPSNPLSLLACFSNQQLGDLGEETARAHLDAHTEIMMITAGDSRAARHDGRQDLDLVIALDGELIAVEVKTRYFAKRAGSLTPAGNIHRPRFARPGTGHRQGTNAYVTARLDDVADIDGEPGVVICAVDLRARLIQLFEVENGRIRGPLGPPEDCSDAILAGMDEMQERLRMPELP